MKYLFIIIISTASPLLSFASEIVNDVTNINPIEVDKVISPTTSDEISKAVKEHQGPISIGGGRFSMGGQTATEKALQIDMRSFKKVLQFNENERTITVQAGIRWRDIQDVIDKENLSLKIMQTYSNFTVGGSLSVNAHGRYMGAGPLVNSVESIKVVLADGKEIIASRKENVEIFKSAIGGYGAVGVITEATLKLVPNEKIRREVLDIKTNKYKDHFFAKIRDNKEAVLHNGDIYPPNYSEVRMETWYRTDKELTIKDRLIPRGQKYWLEPNAISSISTIPYGSEIRQKLLEPLRNKEVVSWRNYEASYDVAQLEPTTPRLLYTYVLQEYFIPVDKFDEFVPKMRKVFNKYNANIVNVSIRHSPAQPDTYLTWAPVEVFSFVVYYKQATTDSAKKKVKVWTQEVIDQVLSVNGQYYLPYQIHATPSQFERAYPGYKKLFETKKKVDPSNKFRNKLWDAYYKT